MKDAPWAKAGGVSDLDEGMIEQHAGGPAAFGLALQAVAQEVLPLRAQLLRDLRLVAHSHFVHDLEVMLVLVPGPLWGSEVQTQGERSLALMGLLVSVWGTESKRTVATAAVAAV